MSRATKTLKATQSGAESNNTSAQMRDDDLASLPLPELDERSPLNDDDCPDFHSSETLVEVKREDVREEDIWSELEAGVGELNELPSEGISQDRLFPDAAMVDMHDADDDDDENHSGSELGKRSACGTLDGKTGSPDKKRKRPVARPSYKCGKCGQMKKGHQCPIKEQVLPRVFKLGWDGKGFDAKAFEGKSDMFIPYSEFLKNQGMKNAVILGCKPGTKPDPNMIGHVTLVPAFVLAGSEKTFALGEEGCSPKVIEAMLAAAAATIQQQNNSGSSSGSNNTKSHLAGKSSLSKRSAVAAK